MVRCYLALCVEVFEVFTSIEPVNNLTTSHFCQKKIQKGQSVQLLHVSLKGSFQGYLWRLKMPTQKMTKL